MNVEDFEKANWGRTQGLTWMLFEDDACEKDVRGVLKHGARSASPFFVEKYKDQVDLLEHLRATHSFLQSSIKLHPVVWMRLLFTSGSHKLQLSDRFLNAYAEWRHLSAQETGGINVSFSRCSALSKDRKELVHIDYFLHATTLEFSFVKNLTVELVHDLGKYEEKAPQDAGRSASDHVGANALSIMRHCINDAVQKKSINGLSGKKDEERFICSLSRLELAKELQKRYKSADSLSLSTLVRGIGEFAYCSRQLP